MKKNHLTLTSITFALLAGLCFLQPANAQIRNQVFAGTRPRSMGDAFVAVADDGNAIYWNPAGLARMERIQANFAYADLFGLGIENIYASFISRVYFIPPLTDYLAFGVDLNRIQFGDDELDFSQNQINFSLAFAPPQSLPLLRPLSAGANAKYFSMKGDLDGNSQLDAGGWGWDAGLLYDVGALPYVPNGFQVGLMVHNLGDGLWVTNKLTEASSKVFQENIRWGLSYRPFDDWPGGKSIPLSDPVIALDFDDRVHLGLEFWLAKTLALRAGWQKDWHTREKASFSFGVGFKQAVKDFPEVRIDYALTDSPVLPNTNKQFGGSLLVRDDPRLLRIEEAYVNDIFASLYQYYGGATGDLGRAKIRNIYHDTLIAEVKFIAPPYTKRDPTPQIIKVPPPRKTELAEEKGIAEVPLRAVFDGSILHCAAQERLNARIEVSYALPRRERFRTVRNVDYVLHGAGCLTWDDPAKAVAFITIGEKNVTRFAGRVAPQDSLQKARKGFVTENIVAAMRLFEALRARGFAYVPDRTTRQALIAGRKLEIDAIDYPAEFLKADGTGGDCDDFAVLFSSLLQSIGIETALLILPDHVFLMFDTGIPMRQFKSLPVDTSLFIPNRGTLWMPVETTALKSTFVEAWKEGGGKYRRAAARNSVQIVEVTPNQRVYPPAEVSARDFPDLSAPPLARPVAENFRALAAMTSAHLKKFEDSLRVNPDDHARRNTYAAILGQNGDRRQARQQLNIILKKNPSYAPALNNLGNLEFVEGRFERAESLYTAAAKHTTLNPAGTYLNLAFLYEMMYDENNKTSMEFWKKKSITALTAAGRLVNNNSELALFLLGLPVALTPGKGKGPETPKAAPDSAGAKPDSVKIEIKEKPPSLGERFVNFIKDSMQILLVGEPLKVTVLDRAGAKRRGEVDEERTWLLWWNV